MFEQRRHGKIPRPTDYFSFPWQRVAEFGTREYRQSRFPHTPCIEELEVLAMDQSSRSGSSPSSSPGSPPKPKTVASFAAISMTVSEA